MKISVTLKNPRDRDAIRAAKAVGATIAKPRDIRRVVLQVDDTRGFRVIGELRALNYIDDAGTYLG